MPQTYRRWSATRRLKCDRRRDRDPGSPGAVERARDGSRRGRARSRLRRDGCAARRNRALGRHRRERPGRVAVARDRLRGLANVELLEGDAYEQLRGRGPFGLVFADGGRPFDWEAILALIEPRGLIVKDDLTPGHPVEGDDVREFLLRDPRLTGAEILATPDLAVIVAAVR